MTPEEARRRKLEVLDFIESRESVTPYDLVDRFGYSYSYACKKLSVLKKQGLVDIFKRGNWILTDAGYRRLYYLAEKFGVMTEGQRIEWAAWFDKEMEKPFEERRIWLLDADGLGSKLVKQGECGVTIEEVNKVAMINKRQRLYGALSTWDKASFPEDEILKGLFNVITGMWTKKRSWGQVANEVERRFGAKFDEESLKFFFNLYRNAVRKGMKKA
jgi:DNA-binding transcriptional ArsR family regulator